MLSLDRAAPFARLGLVLTLAGSLAGCFQPMYATTTTEAGPKLLQRLQDIEVVKIDGRLGNDFRNDMIFGLTGGAGNPTGAPYQLFVVVKSSSTFAIVDTASGLPEAKVIRVAGDWKLVRVGDDVKKPIASGQATAAASIDVSQERFANYSAAQDAERRAAGTLAEMIKTQLAAYFIKNPG